MCKFADEPDSAAFPIGAGCTKTFERSGELVVFANDRPQGYADNRGAVTLAAAPGGVAPGPVDALGGFSARWRDLVDIYNRTAGVPVIAALAIGVSAILLFMPQGRDLVRGVGEDGLGGLAIAFAIGLLFFAIQAWSWSRIVIASNYGPHRQLWRPRSLLEWGPRVLAFVPFVAAGLALLISFKWNASVGLALLAIGVIFLALVVFREPITRRLVGHTDAAPWIQRGWVIAGLAMALVAMVAAILWPAEIGVKLGAPAIVFFGLGFIIPVITIACQLGTSLRIPVTGALLLWAVLLGAFFDNHQVGRRALIAETDGPIDGRPTLESAFKQWAAPAARRSERQEDDGRDRCPGRRVAGGLLDGGGAGAASEGSDESTRKGRQADRFRRSCLRHQLGVGRQRRRRGVRRDAEDRAAECQDADDRRRRRHLHQQSSRLLRPRCAWPCAHWHALFRLALPLCALVGASRPRGDARACLGRGVGRAGRQGRFPHAAGIIKGPFLALAPKEGEPWRPLLIVQGASEGEGRRMLTSAVKFTCDEVDADDLLDGIGHDVAASTAILDGARFPWVSPGGTFTHLPCYAKEGDPKSSDHVLDGGYFDNAGAETLREMTRAIRNLPGGGEKDLDIVFILIGYASHDPAKSPPLPPTGVKAWVSDRIASLIPNDVFAPVLGLYNGMGAHEAHLAREMKLAGQTVVVDPDPYRSRLTGDDLYAALVLCPGDVKLNSGRTITYDPPMDWTLSGEAKRYIENSVIATKPACAAKANADAIEAIVERLGEYRS